MVWATFNFAFFAFLHCSEFTYSGVRKFRPLFDLTSDCIAFHPNLARPQVMSVQLKSSKTDIFRQGRSLTITSTSSILCAVTAMQEYFLLAKPKPGPLFYFQSGRYLNHSTVSHLLRDSSRTAGLPHRSLKGHSFCIGTASVAAAAAAAGLPDWLVKNLGRWSSDCCQLCIRTPQSTLESVAPRMAAVRGVSHQPSFLAVFTGICLGGCIASHASVAVKSAQQLTPSLLTSLPANHNPELRCVKFPSVLHFLQWCNT